MQTTSDPNDFDPREYGIVGFDPLPGYDETDDRLGGTFHYADGSTQVGELPRSAVEKLSAPKASSEVGPPPPPGTPDTRQEMGPPPPPAAPPQAATAPTPTAPQASAPQPTAPEPPAPTPYDAFEAQQADREKGGKALSIDIPKSSRIAYIHNNPGNLKFVGQEGAHQGEPADDGGHWAAFESPEAGYQALHDQIRHDAGAGMTLGAFITKYAPPSSNDTGAYIANAARSLGADPNAPISGLNEERLARFMAHAESSTQIGGVAPDGLSGPRQGQAFNAQQPGAYPGRMNGLPAAEVDVHGTQLTPEQIQARQRDVYDSTQQQVAATQQAAAARVQGRNEAMEAVRQNYVDQQTNANRQLAEQTQIKAQAAQNVQDTLATQLDGNRLLRQTSAGGLIAGLLGSMVSAAGQTMQQRMGKVDAPNLMMQRLNKAIDDDVEDQKQSKQGRLAYWSRVYGDSGQAIAATKAELLNASAQYLQAKTQTGVQNADIQAAATQQVQQLQAAGQQQAAQIQAIEEQKLQIKYAAPKPVKPTNGAEDADKTMKLALHMEEIGYTPDQIKAALGGMGLAAPAGPSVKAQKSTAEQAKVDVAAKKAEEARGAMNEDQGKAEDALGSITDFGTKAGLVRDPKTGHWKPGGGIMSPATQENMKTMYGFNPLADRPIHMALKSAAQSYGHFMAGARIDPDKLEAYEKLLGSDTMTRQQLADALNTAEITIEHRRSQARQETPKSAPEAWQ